MMGDTWSEVTRVCAQAILDNILAEAALVEMRAPEEVIASTRAVLQVEEELLQSLVAAYLEDIRRG